MIVETPDTSGRLLHALGLGLPIALSVTGAGVVTLASSPTLLVLGLGLTIVALAVMAVMLWMYFYEQGDEYGWEVWLSLVVLDGAMIVLVVAVTLVAHK